MKNQQLRRGVHRGRGLSRFASARFAPAILLAATSGVYGQQLIGYTDGEDNTNPINITLVLNPTTLGIGLGTATQSGVISESGVFAVVQKLGGGTLILAADNTYTGGTDVVAGTLQLGTATTAGSLVGASGNGGVNAVTVRSGATFVTSALGIATGGSAASNDINEGGIGVVLNGGGTLINNGKINGGKGSDPTAGDTTVFPPVFPSSGGAGGIGVFIGSGLSAFDNSGTIAGGNGGAGGGTGAIGVWVNGTGFYTSSGTITGGSGTGNSTYQRVGGAGKGVLLDANATFVNSGTITGGNGASDLFDVTDGEAGVFMNAGVFVNNGGTVTGGNGATGADESTAGAAGVVINGGVFKNNSGTITGGKGRSAFPFPTSPGGPGVLINAGATDFTNAGTINGGAGGGVGVEVRASGSFTNSGTIAGNGGKGVQIDAAATFSNAGTIVGGVAVNSGSFINQSGATVDGGTGGGVGVEVAAGASGFSNAGSIMGGDGVNGDKFADGSNGGIGARITLGGTFSNTGSIVGKAGGNGDFILGNGGNGGQGVLMTSVGTFVNGGSVAGGGGGAGGAGGHGGASAAGVELAAGGTVLNSGTISGGGQGVLFGGAAGTLTNSGAITGGVSMGDFANRVTLITGGTISGNLDMSTNTGATLTFDGGGTQAYSSAVTGNTTFAGAFFKEGNGEWKLDKSLAPASATINAGTLRIIDGGSIAQDITDNALLTFDRSDSFTYAKSISGSGSVTKQNTNTLTFTGTSTAGAGVTVTDGVFNVGDGSGNGSITAAHGNNGLNVTGAGTFNNQNGTIQGGAGDAGVFTGFTFTPGQNGGNGVTISSNGTSTNSGVIHGGDGGFSPLLSGNGGAGVKITSAATFDNSGTVVGGSSVGGFAGAGVLASGGAVITNESTGVIAAGNPVAYPSGVGISATSGATTLTNKGAIYGGVYLADAANKVTLFTGSLIQGDLRIGSNTNGRLTLDGPGTQTYSSAVTGGSLFAGSLTKHGAGKWTLDQSMNYSGNTSVNAGTLALTGTASIANSPIISVAPGATFDVSGLTNRFNLGQSQTLAGSGTVKGDLNVAGTVTGSTTINGDVALSTTGHVKGFTTITGTLSGAGAVDPGNSPGLVTAGQIDPSGAMTFNFELTRQGAPDFADPSNIGNDVLRVTGADPFTSALSSANTINLYVSSAAFNGGHTDILGGFFTDSQVAADLESDIDNAPLHIFVADPAGATTYNGETYSPLDLAQYSFDFTAVSQAAQFGAGTFSGAMTELRITSVPEPLSAAAGAVVLGVMVSCQRPRRRKYAPQVRPGC